MDYDLMEKWYKLAAERGNISTHCNLGWYYMYKTKTQKGLQHYKIVVKGGNVASMDGIRLLGSILLLTTNPEYPSQENWILHIIL